MGLNESYRVSILRHGKTYEPSSGTLKAKVIIIIRIKTSLL